MSDDVMRIDTKIEEQVMGLLLGSVAAAALGGTVHWLRHPRGRRTVLTFLVSVLTSAFVGMQSHFLLHYLGAPDSLQFAVSGACGYSAGTLLDSFAPLVIEYARRRLGLPPSAPEKDPEGNDNADGK